MSRERRLALSALTLSLGVACGGGGGGTASSGTGSVPVTDTGGEQPDPTPEPAPAKAFVDATAASGIAYSIGYRIPPTTDPISFDLERFATGGVAAGDYDNDGDIDLLISRGDIGGNLLYRNDGSGVFVDVAAAAGIAYTATVDEVYRHSGPTFADMDGDGDLDFFIGGLWTDPSFIFANNGDGTFTDVTAGSGIDTMQAEHNIGAAFGDYDLDGDLDMFVAHWGTVRDEQNPGDTEHLWRNDTAGGVIEFTSVSVPAGISPSIISLPDPLTNSRDFDTTFTASFARIDADAYPDIVLTADENRSMVFMNNGDGTFDNVTDVDVITDGFGMGSALGDYDDDGDLDWFVTSIMDTDGLSTLEGADGNRLYRNDGGVFVDATDAAGVRDGDWGWGACFMDFENDGDLDIYQTNGWQAQFIDDTSRAFVSDGSGQFTDQAGSLGLDDTEEGRGVVCADFDNDGDVDIFQLHRGSPVAATMWRNENAAGNNYLSVQLNGTPPNTEAAGARISVTVGSRTMTREIVIGNTFVSQNPTRQIFGLGTATQVDELRVEWPDGQVTNYGTFAAGQAISLSQ